MKTESSPTTPQGAGAEHTPTPWQLARSRLAGDICILGDSVDKVVAVCGEFPNSRITECAHNAAFIVKACNSYDQLTARNKELEEALKMADRDRRTNHWRADTTEAIRKALEGGK
jgi:hypothetical protein